MGKDKALPEKSCGVKHSFQHKHKPKRSDLDSHRVSTSLCDSDIHSANAWEDVKFESGARKEKFLRLMGAQKQRKHTGGIQIGSKSVIHTRAGVGVEKIGQDLERQFTEGLEHKSAFTRHAGLGSANAALSPPSRDLFDLSAKNEKPEMSHSDSKYMVNFVKSSE